ncbi:glycosyltransferase [Albibacterium bauzanense]|uniref:Glycosyl transferase family 1 n=1 Tax=Albibacterium bauzanense TaxID=653929 RepID=A0A4V2PYA9_9SPHI|nr:glycosyltransferase [Albibacterium bauzanense]TCK85301.1 glycosyl transferase family 1 [Albibacterium bauzanense]
MESLTEIPLKHILCFSHLRWDFVFQRPQHLLSRFASNAIVYFFEEPVFDALNENYLSISKRGKRVNVIVPHLKEEIDPQAVNATLTTLLDKFLLDVKMDDWAFWYYTPMAYAFTNKFKPKLIIYDCMDELSAFKFAPVELVSLEKILMEKADIVFTGGHSLYAAKKQLHPTIFPFPSSIDKEHFTKARSQKIQPDDQIDIAGPRIGFFGVIDERFDIELIRNIANERPDWQIILIGPVVKISEDILPQNSNIHYLGQKLYNELPAYLSGWDVALIPFELNESTRYISPTKTLEYLAAGVPVVSTPIYDVINPYGTNNLVHISGNSHGFIKIIESELNNPDKGEWLRKVDEFMKDLSWDNTYVNMLTQIKKVLQNKNSTSLMDNSAYV